MRKRKLVKRLHEDQDLIAKIDVFMHWFVGSLLVGSAIVIIILAWLCFMFLPILI